MMPVFLVRVLWIVFRIRPLFSKMPFAHKLMSEIMEAVSTSFVQSTTVGDPRCNVKSMWTLFTY